MRVPGGLSSRIAGEIIRGFISAFLASGSPFDQTHEPWWYNATLCGLGWVSVLSSRRNITIA